nr:uncharacterized protein LOC113739165 [Coffea arabica]
MTISKWSLDFTANKEASIAPVWVSFPGLPLPFFGKNPLMKLASVLGRLMKIDAATGNLRRPSVARVLVEIDVSRVPVKRLWIGDDEYGFWQSMEYEKWPAFCPFCERFGHVQQDCFKKFSDLKPVAAQAMASSGAVEDHGRLKGREEDEGEQGRRQRELSEEKAPGEGWVHKGTGEVGVVEGFQQEKAALGEGWVNLGTGEDGVVEGFQQTTVEGGCKGDKAGQATDMLGVRYRGGRAGDPDSRGLQALLLAPDGRKGDEMTLSNTFAALEGESEELLEMGNPRGARSLSPVRGEAKRWVSMQELRQAQMQLTRRLKAGRLERFWSAGTGKMAEGQLQNTLDSSMGQIRRGNKARRQGVGVQEIASYAEGKIWVLWELPLHIAFNTHADQLVDMELNFPTGKVFFSAVYARCTGVARRPLWGIMEMLAGERQSPWMLAGDFNVISEASERQGGAPPNARNMEEFNQAVFNSGLAPVDFEGTPFTWTNGTVWQRLDRVLANSAWTEQYAISKVLHLARGRSDHAPLLIKCGMAGRGSAAFRFLNVWTRHDAFLGLVRRAWEEGIPVRTMPELHRKLAAVRSKLRVWNKEVFGNIGDRVVELGQIMKAKEERYDREHTTAAKIDYHEARAAYMHQLRRAANYIGRIRSPAGQWLTSTEDIKESAAQFFEQLFTSDRSTDRHPALTFPLPRVSREDNESLVLLPTMEEVREVVFSIHTDSAAGPDGFGSGFYQACWEIIKVDLVTAVQDFFQGGWLSKGITNTSIVLIPKVQGASSWQEFRPISLCNVSSKIVSKIVANRLNRLLPALISRGSPASCRVGKSWTTFCWLRNMRRSWIADWKFRI